jgi:predicted Zn-dependent protease with MMP-like domain
MAGNARLDPLLDRMLNRIDRLWQAGDVVKVKEELAGARKQFPDSLVVLEYHAFLARWEFHPDAALEILETILKKDPSRDTSRLLRTEVLMDLGRFRDALDGLRALDDEPGKPLDPEMKARVFHHMGECFDRIGQIRNADASFEKAAALAPDRYPHPPRLSADEFDSLVDAAMKSIPPDLKSLVGHLNLLVRDYPPPHWDPRTLGVCQVGPSALSGEEIRNVPSTIFLFKRAIEVHTQKREDLPAEVKRVVIHEIAHHFGIPHERMGKYE